MAAATPDAPGLGAPPARGLRGRKKAQTRTALVEAAQRIARRSGVAALRVRAIADAVGVSEASFYNYFGSRDALLSEWAHRQLSEALGQAQSGDGGSLRGRLRRPLRSLAVEIGGDAPLLRDVWARAALAPERRLPGAPSELHARLESAVHEAQLSGELRADLPAVELAGAIRGAAAAAIAGALEAEHPEVEAPLLRAVDLVLDGARKRNERVRPERGAAAGRER